MRASLTATCLIAFLASSALAQQQQPGGKQPYAPPLMVPTPETGPDSLSFGQPLVIGPVGSSQRGVILPDAVAAMLVAGTWQPPQAGQTIDLPDGKAATWQSAFFDDKRVLKSDAFGRGYAYVPIDQKADEVMILDVLGHSMVYVNGEPRVGDPYRNGSVRIPILLRKGRNELLFRGGRGGELKMTLRSPLSSVYIDQADPTLPDLVEGRSGTALGALVVVNATTEWQRGWYFRTSMQGGPETATPIDPIPPLTFRKIAFEFQVPPGVTGTETRLSTAVARSAAPDALAPNSAVVKLRVRKPTDSRRITFRSGIDGSVQYYALRPASSAAAGEGLPLILTLHGADVEAIGQADAYQSKPWCNIVAPTNRRKFGFDWEEWGRTDAMEVLDHASGILNPDPRRIYLTGHSMGGHGTWQIGAHLAPRFAAIAPSAGWISFWSYAGAAQYDSGSPVQNILRRASSPSDTLALRQNYAGVGVYVLHGDQDDNVPVEQAREMRKVLGEFHPDFAYYERPGAGHWWGGECVDWPPLMEFLQRHQREPVRDVRRVRFTTASPSISSACDWAAIIQQAEQLKPSTIDLMLNVETIEDATTKKRTPTGHASFKGTTSNIACLSLSLAELSAPGAGEGSAQGSSPHILEPGKPFDVELDGQALSVPWPTDEPRAWFVREGETWKLGAKPAASAKGPRRAGLFRTAFDHNAILVVGTAGMPEENAWALARARYDAESFWYRGNGSLPIVLDSEFDPARDKDRSVILYGNAASNRAWKALLGESPIQVVPGEIRAGSRTMSGNDLGCLLVRPRPGSDIASVAAVAGTGLPGCQLAGRVPYFQSGFGIPDWLIIGSEAMTKGVGGVHGTGFFGNDWAISEPDSGWAEIK